MNLAQTRKVLEICWRLTQQKSLDHPLILTLVGKPGVGKSSLLKQFHESINKDGDANFYEERFLSQSETGDLAGMISKDESTKKTIWLEAEWWPKPGEKGVLFLDELGDVKGDVRSAIMPLLLTKKLHQHELPEGIMIVCAMNPVSDGYGSRPFTPQFKDRLAFIKVDPSPEEWLGYADTKKLPLWAKSIVAEQPMLFDDTKKGDADSAVWQMDPYYTGMSTRRSYTTAVQVFEAMTEEERNYVGAELLSAIAGDVVAANIMTYSKRNSNELINPADMFDEIKAPALFHTLGVWVDTNNIERLASFVMLLKSMLTNEPMSRDKTKPLADLMAMLPEDQVVSLLKHIQTECKQARIIMHKMAEDPRVFPRLDRIMNPEKYLTKQEVAQAVEA